MNIKKTKQWNNIRQNNPNTKPVLKKVRPLGNLTDIYYTYSHWDSKFIDGVEYISVSKNNPEEFPKRDTTLHWMRKDNMEIVK